MSTHMIRTNISRLVTWFIIGMFFVLSVFGQAAFAAGPTEPVGPQTPTGPQVPTGPQEPTGPQTATGPQVPTGPQTPTGPQPTPTPTPSETPSAAPTTASQNQQTTTDDIDGSSQTSSEPAVTEAATTGSGDLENSTTGANSSNTNTVDDTNQATVTNNNTADIDNAINLGLTTGSNTFAENTKVGNITTGSIEGSVNLVNIANSSFAPGSGVGLQTLNGSNGPLTLDFSANRSLFPSNDTTGANSDNLNVVNQSNILQFITNNTAAVDNGVTISADTGNNLFARNTQLGNITTGAIDLAVNLVNLMNLQLPDVVLNLNIWSVFGDIFGDILLPESADLSNSTTGANSNNTNTVTRTNDIDVNVNQDANVTNDFDFQTETGNNTFDRNSVVGNITTGETTIDGAVTNIANVFQPMFFIFNVFGDWTGTLFGADPRALAVNEVGNDTTGANSNNDNTTTETNQANVDVNNTAVANNTVSVDANTGNNTIQDNSRIGNVTTGPIKIFTNVVNFMNAFGSDLKQFNLGIVNIFGNWKGAPKNVDQTVTAQGSTDQSTTTLPMPAVGSDQLSGQGGGTDDEPLAAAQTTPASSNQATQPSDESTTVIAATTTVDENNDGTGADIEVTAHSSVVSQVDKSTTQKKQVALTRGNKLQAQAASDASDSTNAATIPNNFWIALSVFLVVLLPWATLEILAIRKR